MLDRKTQPAYTLNNTFNLLQPEQVALSNGANVFFIHGGDQEVVKLELIFWAGRWFEAIPGVSTFASQLIPKGSQTRTSDEISQALESLGIHIEITPGFDFVSLTLFGLTKRIDEALAILSDICSSPTYPEKEVSRYKNIFLQNLRINREKTSYLAATTFREHLFGKEHPYGSEVTEGNVQKIQSETLHSFHGSYFKHFVCFATGKIPQSLKNSILNTLSGLPFHVTQIESIQKSMSGGATIKVEKPESVQSSLRIGKRVIPNDHPDYPNLILANHTLGGYFGSRLMQSLREDKGLTYGIHSTIHSLKHESYFVISTDVSKDHGNFAIEEIRIELKKFRTVPLEEVELQLAKNHFLGSLFTELNTPFAHAEKLKNILLNNLDRNYYHYLIEEIQNSTPIKLQSIAESYFNEENMLIVSAG